MTGAATRVKRSRDPPSTHSILDRKVMLKELDASNIELKAGQLDIFYSLLHREHYPPLPEFVERYYENANNVPSSVQNLPLKNAVSSRNRNGKHKLPKKLLNFLKTTDKFVTVTSRIAEAHTSADQSTTKLAIELHDGHVVESVIMRYQDETKSRASLCVSSQVGCAMGCVFCATGTMGIRGNLTEGEILEQLVHAGRILGQEASREIDSGRKPELVRNVVFMGMGEPLNNYSNVVGACRALIDRKRWNLSHGRVTVSTVGVTPKIRNLTRDLPEVSLALSLHAPNQAMRSAIVPAAKNYPIDDLIDAVDQHMMAIKPNRKEAKFGGCRRKRAMIEYVMLEGDTSSFECAHELGRLCKSRHLVVNLIPYNQTDVEDELRCPSEEHMQEFRRIVASYDTLCTIRRTMGADITGACGQLVVQRGVKDIEDQGKCETKSNDDNECGNKCNNVCSCETRGGAASSSQKTKSRITEPSSLASSLTKSTAIESDTESSADDEDMVQWIMPLTIATSVALSCFLVSTTLFLRQRRRN